MKYLLDTNICIYVIKQKPAHVLNRFTVERPDSIGISTITVAELQYGVSKSQRPQQNQAALEKFLAPLLVVNFDDAAARLAGSLKASLEKQGTPIGVYDFLIGAHAVALDTILVTNNSREFQRIPGLRLENWVETPSSP
ncbi:MAG: type II toxin-antitoxin system VapC family toxin [Chloroflexi bacterium]|nr:type II toxin-antitoxin system VapC family toxin [Chloroflexota bacterium]MBP8055260.1 type II toxin-antitoxin system VapC family toxin [Chloroflexota bacterium]